ncbi:MAG: phage head-tail adapter protein [Clostridia bacterium]|nr:phage head-tail adapter protein [Clostridia bacterium]
MNREWSEQNKRMQTLLKKSTFEQGVGALLDLREALMDGMRAWRTALSDDDYSAMPFKGAQGYHSKTVAYSIWHVMRIEDIVVNTLIREKDEVLFAGDFLRRTGSPIITTGNELAGEAIAAFSRQLDIDALYDYAGAVREGSDGWLRSMHSDDLKRRFTDGDRDRIQALGVVSPDESACWLIDYWCGKDVAGLLKMPLSRHWIMHIEAANRIIDRLGRRG